MPLRPASILAVLTVLLASCAPGAASTAPVQPPPTTADLAPLPAIEATATTAGTVTTLPPTTTTLPPSLVPAATIGEPWGEVPGLTMFRGNPTRTFYGTGPLPDGLEVLWRFPEQAMCGTSTVGGEAKSWCGTGWTGQPVVWERPDGVTEVIFGAYDKNIHFVDAMTGERTRPDFYMGDIIKGSVVLDPDGFPLLYVGSRDSRYRIIALDRATPTEIWGLEAASVAGMWNNDWDSSAAIVDDLMLLGGENSWWFAIKLNRQLDAAGQVTVEPETLFQMPMWTDDLLRSVGRQQSVESSTAVFMNTAYIANSAGRIVGIDLSAETSEEDRIVFDYWMGDDVDATIVIDDQGNLYVASEIDLQTARGKEVGQLVKLDPSRSEDPLVWSIDVPTTDGVTGGIWATPALGGSVLYAPTNTGDFLAVDTSNGAILWSDSIGAHAWSSPVIIDETLLVAVDCEVDSGFRAYDIADPAQPVARWESRVTGGCIESTPAVWNGRVYVGSRDGHFYALGAN